MRGWSKQLKELVLQEKCSNFIELEKELHMIKGDHYLGEQGCIVQLSSFPLPSGLPFLEVLLVWPKQFPYYFLEKWKNS
jgi:hypothetical protein